MVLKSDQGQKKILNSKSKAISYTQRAFTRDCVLQRALIKDEVQPNG